MNESRSILLMLNLVDLERETLKSDAEGGIHGGVDGQV